MVTLNFIIQEEYILQKALSSFTKNKSINALKYQLWKDDPDLYYFLSGQMAVLLFQNMKTWSILNLGRRSQKSICGILNSNHFKQLLLETKKYAHAVEKQWNDNYTRSHEIIADITHLTIPKCTINIFISHPALYSGRSYPEQNVITWGHSEDWKDYSTVYLWHEILHHIVYKQKTDANVMHALIELACDNELRIRLNGSGEYFRTSKYTVGHRNLISLEKKILPKWKQYLNSGGSMLELEKTLRKKLPKIMLANFNALDNWADWH
jgi:hypothetical protein